MAKIAATDYTEAQKKAFSKKLYLFSIENLKLLSNPNELYEEQKFAFTN